MVPGADGPLSRRPIETCGDELLVSRCRCAGSHDDHFAFGEGIEEGFAVGELHAIVYITERHLRAAVAGTCTDQVECNALLAVLEAVMGAARMVLSIQYILGGQDSRLTPNG